jgi:hypothetical protein
MATIKRRSRRKVEDRHPITLAWDQGLPPPQEALQADKRDKLIGLMFFRWHETGNHALNQPYLRDWREVLQMGKPNG